jgi:glycine betaine/proline transport system substrate-binding protein
MTTIPLSRRKVMALAASAAPLVLPAAAAGQGLARPDVVIGWTPWSDAEVVTKLAAHVLRERMGQDVELTLADIAAQFRTVAAGDIDLMLMSWEPDLHAPYLRRHGDRLVDLGTLYTGTIGLAVPGWVPDGLIASIEDLARPEVREALDGRIVGIDPGAGLMATTRAAMEAYGLTDYDLTEGTGPGMVREIARAERDAAPLVVTAWRPHSKFALYGMRYLEDPRGLYAAASTIHARANAAFPERAPEIAAMIGRLELSIEDIEALMVAARERGVDAAIADWIDANPDRVAAWAGR